MRVREGKKIRDRQNNESENKKERKRYTEQLRKKMGSGIEGDQGNKKAM